MKILNIANAGEKIVQLFKNVTETFTAASSGEGRDLNAFSMAVNSLVIEVEDEGHQFLNIGDKNQDVITLARERSPLAKKIISDDEEVADIKDVDTSLPKLVQTKQVNGKDINVIFLQPWAEGFYEKDTHPEVHSHQELGAQDSFYLVVNMRLAFSLFIKGEEEESLAVLKRNAINVQEAGADCIVMPQQPGYDFRNNEDPLVRFCRFVAGNKPFGYTVCHGNPIKRDQPVQTERTSFSVPEYDTFNLAVAGTIGEEYFTEDHYDRYLEVLADFKYLVKAFEEEARLSTQTLDSIKTRSKKWGKNGDLSFSRIKVPAEYALVIDQITKQIHPEYPISFMATQPKEESEE
jgi:hypothetical protein